MSDEGLVHNGSYIHQMKGLINSVLYYNITLLRCYHSFT